jgi:transposase
VQLAHAAQQFVLDETRLAITECDARVQRLDAELQRLSAQERYVPLMSAYQALRGVGPVTAATLIAELGDLRRFSKPRSLMSYTGLVPSEYSSGEAEHRGAITKAGNAHVRRVLVETAWHARHVPKVGIGLKRRQAGQAEAIIALSWKAQKRLHRRYELLVGRTHNAPKTIGAVARELVGFIWAIAQHVPPASPSSQTSVAA